MNDQPVGFPGALKRNDAPDAKRDIEGDRAVVECRDRPELRELGVDRRAWGQTKTR
jgi:hypothetical protein